MIPGLIALLALLLFFITFILALIIPKRMMRKFNEKYRKRKYALLYPAICLIVFIISCTFLPLPPPKDASVSTANTPDPATMSSTSDSSSKQTPQDEYDKWVPYELGRLAMTAANNGNSYRSIYVQEDPWLNTGGTYLVQVELDAEDGTSNEMVLKTNNTLAFNVAKALYNSNIDIGRLMIRMHNKLISPNGDKHDTTIIQYTLDKKTAAQINWKTSVPQNFNAVVDDTYLHPVLLR